MLKTTKLAKYLQKVATVRNKVNLSETSLDLKRMFGATLLVPAFLGMLMPMWALPGNNLRPARLETPTGAARAEARGIDREVGGEGQLGIEPSKPTAVNVSPAPPGSGPQKSDALKGQEVANYRKVPGAKSYDEARATPGEVYLLAQAVYGEARGESYVGQVAVAAVILNRTKHPRFPRTIAGVIYEPRAFTAVDDGQIGLHPDQIALRAARAALKGWDPTGGAIYYYNPAKTSSRWIWQRPVIGKIGRHVFAL